MGKSQKKAVRMKNRKIPMRQCVGCREMKPKRELVRVIRTLEGEVTVDVTGKKNGRGAYICKNQSCLSAAVKSKGLERSLKTSIPQEIYAEFEKEMQHFETG